MSKIATALACAALFPLCAQTLLVMESGEGVRYVTADAVQVNGKDRVRAAGATGSFTEKQYGQMAASKLTQWPVLVRDWATGDMLTPKQQIVVPDGANGAGKTGESWNAAVITYAAPGDKSRTTLAAGRLLAILQGGAADELAANYAGTAAYFQHPEGADAGLQAQGRAMAAAVATFPKSEALGRIGRELGASLTAALAMLDSGTAEPAHFQQARLLAKTSSTVFAEDTEHRALRARLAEREALFERGQAMLAALAAGEQWDEYLHYYRGLEKYQFLFPEMQKSYRDALRASKERHRKRAESRAEVKDFAAAHREYLTALSRDPGDETIKNAAENMRLSLTRVPRARNRNLDPTAPAVIVLNRMIADGLRYMREGDLGSAEREFSAAAKQNAEYPPLLLARAQWLQASKQLSGALAVLDRYDAVVSGDKEWQQGEEIRRDIGFQLKKSRQVRDAELVRLLNELQFGSALRLARSGLEADAADVDLLYRTGLVTAMTGDRKGAAALLTRYLDASNNLSGDAARRRDVLRFLALLQQERMAAQPGPKHWASGRAMEKGAQYDPASLAFLAPVERVKGGKWTTTFEWTGGKLRGVAHSSEDKPAPPPVVFRFGYGPEGVTRAFQEEPGKSGEGSAAAPKAEVSPRGQLGALFGAAETVAPKAAEVAPALAADVGQLRKGLGYPVLTSANAALDLPLIERMTGLRLGYVVAGNRYFHPFAWQKLHLFEVSYDVEGRVARARAVEAHGEPNAGGEVLVFRWDGQLLGEISGHPALANGDPDTSRMTYRRTMQYRGGRLQGEEIEAGGKKAKISYRYDGEQLAEAECDEDPVLDQRSRRAVFAK